MSLARRAIEEFGACQKAPELEQLIAYLADVKLERVLEIGTQDGGTLWLLGQLAEPYATVVSVDIDNLANLDLELGAGQHRVFIAGDSHHEKTYYSVRCAFDGPRWPGREAQETAVDLLFIDGDHSYEGVKQDFETYSPLVRSGGVIALHDVVTHAHPELSEVDRLWAELLPSHPEALQFVDDGLGDTWRGRLPVASCGIGVIRQP